jgi:hypothetical protein
MQRGLHFRAIFGPENFLETRLLGEKFVIALSHLFNDVFGTAKWMKAFLDFFNLRPEPSRREQRLLDSPIFPGCAQVIA